MAEKMPNSRALSSLVKQQVPKIESGLLLYSSSSYFTVLNISGEGTFGKVARCKNLTTEETVAVKFLKKKDDFHSELSVLEAISMLDLDKTNIVKFLEHFKDQGLTCLVFELLDINLKDWIRGTKWKPLLLGSIRPIAKQLFVALDALQDVGIVHADIKPDNIMLVNLQDQPLRIKLIDFGTALPAPVVEAGMVVQAPAYRAPEIWLGLPFTTAIDAWGVGCILAFLYNAKHLFWVPARYLMMKAIVQMVGQPGDHMLCAGMYTRRFFLKEKAADGPTWRLKTAEEYTAEANKQDLERLKIHTNLPNSLEDLILINEAEQGVEHEDRLVFLDLMKQLLHVDGDQRISPHQALQHPFVTMEHLRPIPNGKAYAATSKASMSMPWICDGDIPTEVYSTDAPDLSASTSHHRKWLKRIRRFFKLIMSSCRCYINPRGED